MAYKVIRNTALSDLQCSSTNPSPCDLLLRMQTNHRAWGQTLSSTYQSNENYFHYTRSHCLPSKSDEKGIRHSLEVTVPDDGHILNLPLTAFMMQEVLIHDKGDNVSNITIQSTYIIVKKSTGSPYKGTNHKHIHGCGAYLKKPLKGVGLGGIAHSCVTLRTLPCARQYAWQKDQGRMVPLIPWHTLILHLHTVIGNRDSMSQASSRKKKGKCPESKGKKVGFITHYVHSLMCFNLLVTSQGLDWMDKRSLEQENDRKTWVSKG